MKLWVLFITVAFAAAVAIPLEDRGSFILTNISISIIIYKLIGDTIVCSIMFVSCLLFQILSVWTRMETLALVVWVEEEDAMDSRSKHVARPFISGPNGVKVC